MTDAEKRGKVMRGLEAHANPKSCETCAGEECPYYNKAYYNMDDAYTGVTCSSFLAADALALLKEQEARLVTTADFENNPNLDDSGHLNVWEEYKDSTRSGWNTINVNDVIAFTDIRRYWTARPTEEQRKAVKWDE